MGRTRTIELVALTGALALGLAVYVFIGGMAGGYYAAAALIFGLFLHFRLTAGEEESEGAADAPPVTRVRWSLGRNQNAELEQELAAERARAVEGEARVEALRAELEEQREIARALEQRLTERLARLEAAHEAEIERIVAGVSTVDEELAALERLAGELSARSAPWLVRESPSGGVAFRTS